MDWTTVAQEAYRAYGEVTDFKNFQGNPMPEWGDLPDTIQDAWRAAARRACFARYADLVSDDRERKQVQHALLYADHFANAGVPGHGQFLLIAKLARALGIGVRGGYVTTQIDAGDYDDVPF